MVGALLDAEAPEEFVNNLILSVRSLLPVDRLVEVGFAWTELDDFLLLGLVL